MIRSIRLRNFKTHVDTTVELGRLTVLLGPNGAGKSSVLGALSGMAQLVVDSALERPGDRQSRIPPLSNATRRGCGAFELMVAGDGWHGRLRGDDRQRRWSTPAVLAGRSVELTKIDDKAQAALIATELLELDAGRLATPALLVPNPSVEPDGYGLATVIAEMILGGSERFAAIVEDVRRVVPQVVGLRVHTVADPDDESWEGSPAGLMELLVRWRGDPHPEGEGERRCVKWTALKAHAGHGRRPRQPVRTARHPPSGGRRLVPSPPPGHP